MAGATKFDLPVLTMIRSAARRTVKTAQLEGDPDTNQTPLAKKIYAAFAEIKEEDSPSSWTVKLGKGEY